MSHKVHPKSYRIRTMEDWNSRGFYGKKMHQFLEEDVAIKKYLTKVLAEAMVANVQIERSAGKLTVIIDTGRPGLIIGRGGQGTEQLKKAIERIRAKGPLGKELGAKDIKIEIREVKNPWISAPLVAKMSAQQIERRMPFRGVLKKTIERVMSNREVEGVRMEMSGRLNGVEIARREWLAQGKLPRNTIRANIDYAFDEARCTYGKIGIKVWIYKGEKFE